MNRNLLITLMFLLIIIGIATLNGNVLALALPFLVALGLGFADAPPVPQLHAVRTVTPDRTAQGQPASVSVTITNDGPALFDLELRDLLPQGLELIEGQTELLTALAPGASAELNYVLRGNRGLYAFGDLQAIARDRLGLFPRTIAIAASGRLFILPALMRLRQVSIRPRRTRVYSGTIPAHQGGPGVEFFGVRPYQPGDPLRRVNSRVSARYAETLFVNEFEQERVADVGIILDARARSDIVGPHGSLFEHGIQAAAALADSLLVQGNRVGLLVYGDSIDWTFPGYGKLQREKILRALAAAQPGDRIALETLDSMPTRLFPIRSLLIVISPLLLEDVRPLAALRGRGYQMIVISPDPVSFERMVLGRKPDGMLGAELAEIERMLLLKKLSQAGVATINWPIETPFQLVAAQALGRVPVL